MLVNSMSHFRKFERIPLSRNEFKAEPAWCRQCATVTPRIQISRELTPGARSLVDDTQAIIQLAPARGELNGTDTDNTWVYYTVADMLPNVFT